MPITIDQIVEESRSLPHDKVAELVDRILLAAHGGQSPEHASAWSAVVQKRIADIRHGKVTGIPGEETSAKIRRIVGK